jgi:hypothetical protein
MTYFYLNLSLYDLCLTAIYYRTLSSSKTFDPTKYNYQDAKILMISIWYL